MQIVIDIDDNLYTRLFDNGDEYVEDMRRACVAIRKGKSLPEGYGDLVDRNAINERFYSIYNDAMNCSNQPSDKYLLNKWSMCLDTVPAIIEAGTERSDKGCR